MEESRRWTRRQRVAGLVALALAGGALAWIWLSGPDRTGTTLRDETGAVVSWRFGESRRSDPLPAGDSPFGLLVDGTTLDAHWADVPCGEHAEVVVRGDGSSLRIDAGARKAVFAAGCDTSSVGFTLRLSLTEPPRTASLTYRGFLGDRHEAAWPAPAATADRG